MPSPSWPHYHLYHYRRVTVIRIKNTFRICRRGGCLDQIPPSRIPTVSGAHGTGGTGTPTRGLHGKTAIIGATAPSYTVSADAVSAPRCHQCPVGTSGRNASRLHICSGVRVARLPNTCRGLGASKSDSGKRNPPADAIVVLHRERVIRSRSRAANIIYSRSSIRPRVAVYNRLRIRVTFVVGDCYCVTLTPSHIE